MSFDIDIGFTSLAGRKPVNEDFAAAMLPAPGEEAKGAIVAIADGVSTGGMGREAAQTTVTSLVRDYFGTPETWDTTVALDRIIGAQNAWLAGLNRRRHPALGLCTLTALVLRGQSYALAHVGDTRAYLLREGRLNLLTQDHAVAHPDFRHQLLRAVGQEDRVIVDYSQGDAQVGDLFVLLSDGVHGALREPALRELLRGASALSCEALSAALVDAALAAGSADNLTALLVRVRGLLDGSLEDENRRAQRLPALPRLKPGERLDGMEVLELAADNGVNLIYRMRDRDGRHYALKTLHPQRARDGQERTMLGHEAWLARCMMSGGAAAHLVALHDGPPGGLMPSGFYLLYDWHGGETLQQMLDRKARFDVAQAVGIAQSVAQALGRLHRQCVIHRDIKPANLHLGRDGVLRILDLGVALSGREPESTRLLHAGTPSYINPEQWGYAFAPGRDGDAAPPDAGSDLFALGVTLYQLLCAGRLPYGEVLPYQGGRYFRDPVAPSRHNPVVPIWLDHVVLKAVARDRRQRFETAEELLLALERGASRVLAAPPASPLLARDSGALWKSALALSLLLNLLLVYWLLFLPR